MVAYGICSLLLNLGVKSRSTVLPSGRFLMVGDHPYDGGDHPGVGG